MILFGICIRKDRDGVNFAIRIRGWEKIIYLKKYPKPEAVKAPEMAYPSMLTEMPMGRVYEPEDIEHGEPEPIKVIEPEDM